MNHVHQLKTILEASGWPQERLAQEIGVSFPALNAWINRRSKPRQKALRNIERVYLDIVGGEKIDQAELECTKKFASGLHIDPERLVADKVLLDKLTLHLTYHTNTIEGSAMTLSDVEGVIFERKVLSNRTAVEQAEARNHQSALLWVLEQLTENRAAFALDENFIQGIHLRLMNGIVSDAGQYRKHGVRIMGSRAAVANWMKIRDLLAELTGETVEPICRQPEDTVAALAEFHAVFERIHPFSDGNGRTGRLLMLAQALRAGLMPPLIVKERRYAYYKYLELAQTAENYQPLELFVAQSMLYCQNLLDG